MRESEQKEGEWEWEGVKRNERIRDRAGEWKMDEVADGAGHCE